MLRTGIKCLNCTSLQNLLCWWFIWSSSSWIINTFIVISVNICPQTGRPSAQRTSDTETLHVCDQVAMETLSQNQCTAALGSVPPLFSVNQQLSFQSGGLMSFNVSRWFSHRSNTTFTQWSSEESTVCLLCERWASVLVVYCMCGTFVQTCCINCRLQFNMSQ